jgi:Holliday junction resolvase RusA-like endonuclease
VRLTIIVHGRPAPQGSKELGSAGQLRESSAYLAAWRQQVIIGAYEAYRTHGIQPASLPLFPAGVPVTVEELTFWMAKDQCRAIGTEEPIGKPDIDKLLRSTLDALGGAAGRNARLFADDSQIVDICNLRKRRTPESNVYGARITVSDGRDQE